MKIVIAGDGKVGAMLTKQLSAEGYDLTLIDADLKVLESTEERYDIITVQGNCASMEILEKAGFAYCCDRCRRDQFALLYDGTWN